MSIALRTPEEIDAIARAGDLVWSVIDRLAPRCEPGVTTRQLDDLARAMLTEAGADPVLERVTNESGDTFPGVCCVNVCEQVAHSAPSERKLRDGDLVGLDLSASLDGWCADACRTIGVGGISSEAERLGVGARACLDRGVRACEGGRMWSEVASAIRTEAKRLGLCLVPGLGGHGIGRSLHESPLAWLDPPGADFRLHPGMVLTIEPVVTNGSGAIETDPDGWTLRTQNGSWAACEERTIAILPEGPRILTGPALDSGSH